MPIPVNGNLIKLDWFKRYDDVPMDTGYYVQSWDTASKNGTENDFSVCTTWRVYRDLWYLVDVYRKKHMFPELKQAILNQRDLFKPKQVLIEDASSGTSLIQDLRNKGINITSVNVQKGLNKEQRAEQASMPIFEGSVFIPHKAIWLAELEHEIHAFPNGKHDDQVDSMTQFINWKIHQEKNVMTVSRVYAR